MTPGGVAGPARRRALGAYVGGGALRATAVGARPLPTPLTGRRSRPHNGPGVPEAAPPVYTRLTRPAFELMAMPTARDPRVDAYIDALPDWQQAVCRQVRALIHDADPEIEETIKFTDRPYFVLAGNVCALLAAKTHVNVFLYDGAIVPDPEGIITGGHDNKTARTVAIRRGEPLNAPALTAMLRQIIANNRAGGWRRLKRDA